MRDSVPFVTVLVAKHWQRLPGEAVESPSLELCKRRWVMCFRD